MMMGFGLLIVLVLGGAAFLLFLRGTDSQRPSSSFHPTGGESHKTARRLLDERLARGDIEQEEYERIRGQIES